MKKNKILDKIRKARQKYVDIFIDNSFDLSDRIEFLLEKKGMDQKELALAMKKNESEISKWLSGSHNFTLKTLAKIEDVLGEKLIEVVSENREKDDLKKIIILDSIDLFPLEHNLNSHSGMKKYSGHYRKTSIAIC